MPKNPRGEKLAGLRGKILSVLQESVTTPVQNAKCLLQCVSLFRNQVLLQETAKELQIQLEAGACDSAVLELYYDLSRGQNSIGYISKGWDDPGFRVGEVVDVLADRLTAETLKDLLNFCAVQGVAFTIAESNPGLIELRMDSVIYSEGFNKDVLRQVLECLSLCVEKARSL